MYNGDELYLEPGLHITNDMFDHGCDGVASHEWGVDDHSELFDLEVDLVQGLEGTTTYH